MDVKREELILYEFAGQKCDVKIRNRQDGSVFVIFESESGFGNPMLDLEQLESLVRKCKTLGCA